MCPNCDIILWFYFLPHLDHFLPAVLILPLPLQYFFLLWDDLRKVTKQLKRLKHWTGKKKKKLCLTKGETNKKETFVWHLLSCNPKRVVQVFGQVGTLAFDVVGGPGVQRVLGYSRVYGWWQVPVLLPGISREEGEERKHHKPNRATHMDPLRAHRHTLNRNTPNQIKEGGDVPEDSGGQPVHDWMKQSSLPQY